MESHWRKRIGLVLGSLAFLATLVFPAPEGLAPGAWRTLGIASMMGLFWMLESAPFPATAMLPLVLFPLCGIAPIDQAAAPFANPVIFLFLGGILIALGMEKCNLHRRIAIRIVRWMGTRPTSVIAGFLIAAAFLSMWINNTATAVMMLPIGLSVIALLDSASRGTLCKSAFAPALMLAIAYGANLGGTMTLIGTAPNALFAGFAMETYGVDVGFAQWMVFAVPVALIVLPVTLFVLSKVAFKLSPDPIDGAKAVLDAEALALGTPSRAEHVVGTIFFLTALLWITRPLIQFPGLSDPLIAMLGGLSLFFIPSGGGRDSGNLLDWKTAGKIPWDVLLLIGGGLSLASAIRDTGLAGWMGAFANQLGFLPFEVVVGIVAAAVLFLTELTSNTATTAAFLPIAGSIAVGMGENPLLVTAVAALAASGAFMLPVATPPNAIVFGSGLVSVPQMMKAGLMINGVFLLVLALLAAAIGSLVLPMPPAP